MISADTNSTVIIPMWNGGNDVLACLRAVQAQQPPPSAVIVVDNGSTDGCADIVARDFASVRLIRLPTNIGFAGACNVGLRSAEGELLVLLNQDTFVQSGWLAALSAAATTGVGVIGALARRPDGQMQHAGGVVNTRGEGYHVTALGSSDPDYVTGASLAITRECYEAIGDLDEGFSPAYYEDVDWCFRAREAGYRVVMAPNAVLVHLERSVAALQAEHAYAFHRNRIRFVLKHWEVERLRAEFAPAERDWLSSLGPGGETLIAAMHRAYFDHLLSLPELSQQRPRGPLTADEARGVADVLIGLRMMFPLRPAQGSEPLPATGADGMIRAAAMLRSIQSPAVSEPVGAANRVAPEQTALPTDNPHDGVLSEPVNRSNLTVTRSAKGGLRNLVGHFFVRAYVAPLLEQQADINRRLSERLDEALTRAIAAEDRVNQLAAQMSVESERRRTIAEASDRFVDAVIAYVRDSSADRERVQASETARRERHDAVWTAYAQELARELTELAQVIGEARQAGHGEGTQE